MAAGVYMITCVPTGDRYIGSAVNLERRRQEHFRRLRRHEHCNRNVQGAWDRHGESALVFEVVEYCNPEECRRAEQRWLDRVRPELNIAKDAVYPMRGRQHDPDTLRRIGEAISRALTGRRLSPEARAKMSEARRGNTHRRGKVTPPEVREKIRASMQARCASAECRASLRQRGIGNKASLGKTPTAETRAKMSSAHRGKRQSEETKAKKLASFRATIQRRREERAT